MSACIIKLLSKLFGKASANEDAELAQPWTVYVDSNYHFMHEDERYSVGSFENYDDALCICKKIVNEFLTSAQAKTADELFKSYVGFGEAPWIKGSSSGSEQVNFSAIEYARQRCDELFL
mgnify:CR=1 FL=1|jgi:hypothetical protein